MRDEILKCLLGRRWWSSTPELVDQPFARDDLVRVQGEDRQEAALTPSAEVDPATVHPELERAKDSNLHIPHFGRRRANAHCPSRPGGCRLPRRYRPWAIRGHRKRSLPRWSRGAPTGRPGGRHEAQAHGYCLGARFGRSCDDGVDRPGRRTRRWGDASGARLRSRRSCRRSPRGPIRDRMGTNPPG